MPPRCAGLGWVGLCRGDPRLAAFLALVFALVLIPASTSHLANDRLRLPLDFLFIPLAALFIDRMVRALERLGPSRAADGLSE